MTDNNLLEVKKLKKYFPVKRGVFRKTVGYVRAVDDVSFDINQGETLSLVGESGCGKTTTSRCILRALDPTDGQIWFKMDGNEPVNLADLDKTALREYRKEIQMIFQDPFASLNARMNLFENITEPMLVNGIRNKELRQERASELMKLVGLPPEYLSRYPHAFSGGQRQRIGIARALSLNPSLIVADEPVSALDVSVQAQILNLMLDLQNEFNLTYLFVAHDLSVVKLISHRVAVMYVGRIVELAETEELYHNPMHPYTEALMASIPIPDPCRRAQMKELKGQVADPANPPSGCYFHPRCAFAQAICSEETPQLREITPGHHVSCHLSETLTLSGISKS